MPNNGITLRDRYRDYRRLMEVRAEEAPDGAMIVRGTPVIFDKEYKLFTFGDTDVYTIKEKPDEFDYTKQDIKIRAYEFKDERTYQGGDTYET